MEHCVHCPTPGLPCPARAYGACDLVDPSSPRYDPEAAARAVAGPVVPPSFLARMGSFFSAMTEHVAAGCPMPAPEVVAERLAICRACPDYAEPDCRRCGCHMPTKAAMALVECPIGKWEKAPAARVGQPGPEGVVPDA